MSDRMDGRTQELQARLAERDDVRRRLTEARDAVDRETGRLGTIELALELTQAEIDRLESVSATSLLSSLMGTRAGKLDAARQPSTPTPASRDGPSLRA